MIVCMCVGLVLCCLLGVSGISCIIDEFILGGGWNVFGGMLNSGVMW